MRNSDYSSKKYCACTITGNTLKQLGPDA